MPKGKIKFAKFRRITDCYYQRHCDGQFKKECAGESGLFKSQFGGQTVSLCEYHNQEVQNVERILNDNSRII